MFKKLAFLAILVVVLAAAYGAAATLGVTGGAIQYGIDADLTCDDTVKVAGWVLETDDSTVRGVRIGDISSACYGNSLFVKVLDVGGSVLAEGEVEGIDTEVESVSFNKHANPQAITQLKIWIEGGNP